MTSSITNDVITRSASTADIAGASLAVFTGRRPKPFEVSSDLIVNLINMPTEPSACEAEAITTALRKRLTGNESRRQAPDLS